MMNSRFAFTTQVLLMLAGGLSLPVLSQVSKPALPAAFEPNRGQATKEYDFVAKGLGYAVGLSGTQARIILSQGPGLAPETVSLYLVHARQGSTGRPVDQLKSINSYFSGKTAITGIPTFAKIRYDSVWPGVDVLYYGTGQQLENDFIVAPRANPNVIRLRFDGAQSMRTSPEGDLILKTATRELVEAKPTAYQLNGANRVPVAASYRVGKGGTVEIELGNYDHSKELVIDPITRYLFNPQGDSVNGDGAFVASAVASFQGKSIVVGWTPPILPCQTCSTMYNAAFVSVFDPSGNLIYETVLSAADGNVFGSGVTVDASGNVYLTGYTTSASTGFPLANAYQSASGGEQDAFLSKLSPTLGSLLFSTYLGGSGNDNGSAVAVVGTVAYVVGATTSTNFPSSNPPAGTNAFVFALDTSQSGASAKVYGLAVGGSGTDSALGAGVDSTGNLYVGGATTSLSSTFVPTIGAASYLNSKTTTNNDGFLIKLNSAGTLLWGTFFPGGAVNGVAVSGTQAAIVGQVTAATLQTTASAYQLSGHVGNGFVAKFDTAQTGAASLLYSTYLGGSGDENVTAVTIGLDNNIYAVGVTTSSNFPTAGTPAPLQPTFVGGSLTEDGFLSVLNPTLSSSAGLVYSTFVGSGGNTVATGVAIDGFDYNQPTVSTITFSTNNQFGSIYKYGTFGPTNAGIFRQGFLWVLDTDGNQQQNIPPDYVYAYGGIPGDIPITGDWNGDGHTKIGIYRPSNGLFILDTNGNGVEDAGDSVFNLHIGEVAGDIPVTGDWNGDGRTKVGYFRQNFLWILDTNGDGRFDSGDQSYVFGGIAGDLPVTGDWTGTGTSKIGVFRNGYLWVLDANGNGTLDSTDPVFPFGGIPGDLPVTGDWNGDGVTKVGIFRQGFLWVLDANGDHVIDAGDYIFGYGGITGDVPVVGKWQ